MVKSGGDCSVYHNHAQQQDLKLEIRAQFIHLGNRYQFQILHTTQFLLHLKQFTTQAKRQRNSQQ
jgi:hypothetical protein